MSNAGPDGQLKPLTLWEKIKVGASSFFKSAKDYIPSGLIYTGLALGGSLAITALTGFDLMGLMAEGGGVSLANIALKGGGTLLLGSAVTGAMGAWSGISNANEQRAAEMEWQQRGVQVSPRARGLQQQRGGGEYVTTPQMGLPSRNQQQGQQIRIT